jgi:hypothetical protein
VEGGREEYTQLWKVYIGRGANEALGIYIGFLGENGSQKSRQVAEVKTK